MGHADDQLDALMGDAQRGDLGHGFDDASRTIHMPKASEPTVSAATVQTTEQAIDRYATIVARGGWPRVPAVTQLRLGDRHPSVNDLRARLVASSDIDPNAVGNDIYDSYVEAAVRRFQARHGLTVDGIIRKETLAALNVPAPVRLAQLKVNVTRLRTLSTNLGPRYVVCNLPAARIEAIENGVAVSRHTAVVGKPDRPSPEINSKIVEINFNPYWTVPASIVRRTSSRRCRTSRTTSTKQPHPHLRRPPQGAAARGHQLVLGGRDQLHVPPGSGRFNSLGSIRINFPNPHQVYMHDTPLKNLFGEDFRFHSSGCVRVQNVRELVAVAAFRRRAAGRAPRSISVIKSGELKTRTARQSGASALGLCHRLGHGRRRRAVPRGHLRPRRPSRGTGSARRAAGDLEPALSLAAGLRPCNRRGSSTIRVVAIADFAASRSGICLLTAIAGFQRGRVA